MQSIRGSIKSIKGIEGDPWHQKRIHNLWRDPIECIAKISFSPKSFFVSFEIDFCFFLRIHKRKLNRKFPMECCGRVREKLAATMMYFTLGRYKVHSSLYKDRSDRQWWTGAWESLECNNATNKWKRFVRWVGRGEEEDEEDEEDKEEEEELKAAMPTTTSTAMVMFELMWVLEQ